MLPHATPDPQSYYISQAHHLSLNFLTVIEVNQGVCCHSSFAAILSTPVSVTAHPSMPTSVSIVSVTSMSRPSHSPLSRTHARDVESYLHHQAERIGKEQAHDCIQTMLVQVWHGDKCLMEAKVVERGTLVQSNDCPMVGTEGLTQNKVDLLAAPFVATPPSAPPISSSHGPSLSIIFAILAATILLTVVAVLFMWDLLKQRLSRRARQGSGTTQAMEIHLEDQNGRSERQRVLITELNDAPANIQREGSRVDDIAHLPCGLRLPRRPQAVVRGPADSGPHLLSATSEETLPASCVSERQVHSFASQTTLRGSEAGDDVTEVEGAEPTSGPVRQSSLAHIARFRSWRGI